MRKRFLTVVIFIIVLSLVFAGCGKAKTNDGTSKSFTLTVVDGSGSETVYDFQSDKQYLGDMLTEEGIIDGEEGPYGLYIKSVCGIPADYDTDGTYWAFYVNDEYALSGIDLTEIEDGAHYALKVEK